MKIRKAWPVLLWLGIVLALVFAGTLHAQEQEITRWVGEGPQGQTLLLDCMAEPGDQSAFCALTMWSSNEEHYSSLSGPVNIQIVVGENRSDTMYEACITVQLVVESIPSGAENGDFVCFLYEFPPFLDTPAVLLRGPSILLYKGTP